MHKNIIPQLIEQLKLPLPGWDAQRKMSPLQTAEYRNIPSDAKRASVSLLLYPDQNTELQVLYIKRTSLHPDDKHSGQISFPGGQKDESDVDALDTALREVDEEVGIHRSHIQVLGELTPIYVYVSRFLVRTYVGFMTEKPQLTLQETEVDKVFHVPLPYLLSEDSRKITDYKVRDHILKDMPYYDIEGQVLWGATAMITSEFLDIVRSATI